MSSLLSSVSGIITTDSLLLAESKLRQAKVRVTQARKEVLSVLLVQRRALSHTEMQDALPAMDRVTLYRALDCLAEVSLAHKITGDDRVFRFSGHQMSSQPDSQHPFQAQEKGVTQHQHGHFQCTRCAQVFCLEQPDASHTLRDQLQATLQATSAKGFQIHNIEVTIKGWCARCQ
ncbi:Fur family transcriptional regulator [Undibacterium fentianense]|uniref:Transcriptional repressor n=1 Tax=Undibacterium fentianense TaxID=2828728 RepID=A0A941E3C1_9BURK|nr:transcriptional repressor [Undibacterium fentianense]MBR7800452.1 transcriptional repressor [Undibacterium fentianense]